MKPRKLPYVISPVGYQFGLSRRMIKDKRQKAMLPGKRMSKTHHIYYEYRMNRSDLKGGI